MSASARAGMTLCLKPACNTVGLEVVRRVGVTNPAAVPVARASSSGDLSCGSTPTIFATPASNSRVVAVRRTGHSIRPSRTTASASAVMALSRICREPCAAAPRLRTRNQSSPFSPVCNKYARFPSIVIEYPPTSLIASVAPAKTSGSFSTNQSDRTSPHPPDPPRRASKNRGMIVNEPVRPEHAARFFVREKGDDEIALRLRSGAEDVPQCGQNHRIHVFHVDRTTAPQHAILDGASKRVNAPLGCLSRHDIQMPVHNERGLRAVASGYPDSEARSTRIGLEEAWSQSQPGQVRFDVFSGLSLTVRSG